MKLTGKFVKIQKTGSADVLAWVADGMDSYHAMKEVQKLLNDSDYNGVQAVEDNPNNTGYEMNLSLKWNEGEKINRRFETVCYSFINLHGQIVKSIIVKFDFENSLLYIDGRKYRVEENRGFVYNFLKTKVKAIGGIKGLYNCIVESMDGDSVFNCRTYGVLEKASKQ